MNSKIEITTIQNNEKLPINIYEGKTIETDKEIETVYIDNGSIVKYVYTKGKNTINIIKKGIGENSFFSELKFEENVETNSKITTEMYTLDVNIQTQNIKYIKKDKNMQITMEYDINGAHNIVNVNIKLM